MELTVVRSGERSRYKRCPKAWYWAWRKGLVPRNARFGALELGTWVHAAFALWYLKGRKRRKAGLKLLFVAISEAAIAAAQEEGAPEHVIDQAWELQALGMAMMDAYQERYGNDSDVEVIGAEIPLEFWFADDAVHRLKPDLLYADKAGDIWLMEHKTAQTIRTEHLVINGQGASYAAMAERALCRAGVLTKSDSIKGVMYNFLRKKLPDLRPENPEGKKLNKDGSVSKSQPGEQFVRHPLVLTREQKRRVLHRVAGETKEIQGVTRALKAKTLDPADLKKTDHHTCPKYCEFFAMCVSEEKGADIRMMESTMYFRRDPYVYEEDTADEIISFEMG
jgi:hypothetical protein